MTLHAEYVLPLRWTDDDQLDELARYLDRVVQLVDVTVVDGSPAPLFERHTSRLPSRVRILRPEQWPGGNGKVAGVMTGVRHARHERVVLADDDVRYDEQTLRAVVDDLDDADVVRPQNFYHPLPWHARWDTARILINRGLGSDYPGTLAVRRRALLDAGGYDGDVLFENLELIRTITARGGVERRADDVFVARRPATTRHFLGQRVRQAYDDFAQPTRLVSELLLLPLLILLGRKPVALGMLFAAAVLVARRGRRRATGNRVFPPSAPFWAPFWLLERAGTVWVALHRRLQGGIPYAGARLRRAATPLRDLRTEFEGRTHGIR